MHAGRGPTRARMRSALVRGQRSDVTVDRRTVLPLVWCACIKAQTVSAHAVAGGADVFKHAPALHPRARLFAQT
eukprot:9289975-Alexandrium_andersonii.AAC.1